MSDPVFDGYQAGQAVRNGSRLLTPVNTTPAATAADTVEATFFSYTLPAGFFSTNGKTLRITAFGTLAANANGKTITGKIGGTTICTDNGTINGGGWRMVIEIIRTGVGAQVASGNTVMLRTELQNTVALTKDETTALTIAITGTNGVASAADITFKGVIVEVLN